MITKLDDVRPDSEAEKVDVVNEHLENTKHLARMMAGEYAALVEEGVSPFAAALIVGQRWRMTS